MESLKDVWNLVCERCQKNNKISKVAYKVWICCIEPVSFEKDEIILKVKTKFQKDIITKNFLNILNKEFEEVLGFNIKITIITGEDQLDSLNSSDTNNILCNNDSLENKYTFDSFVVGPSNKFAHAAALAVAANPARAYNPLFIHGGSGLGKTHLLYAIKNEVSKKFADFNIIYVKGDDFTNEMISAIQHNTTVSFHNKYRTADIFFVDDIQFIAGKESTQEAFFHTFNALFEAGKQIILTSDRPPKEIGTLEERLRTRFESGLLADIQPPNIEMRTAIIKRKAELINLDISDEIAEYIAKRIKTNIRQLEGTIKKMKAYNILNDMPPSIQSAQNAIRDILNDSQPVSVTIDKIINEVARTYGVTPEDIRSKKRSAVISTSRQVAMFVVRDITQMPLSSIGKEFGGRDHSTIVYAIQQVEKNMKEKQQFKAVVNDIIKNVRDK